MIKECILTKTGILFDLKYLKESLGFDFNGLLDEMHEMNITPEGLGMGYEDLRKYAHDSTVLQHIRDLHDKIFDELSGASGWWFLEALPPTLFTYQDPAGDWICIRRYMFLPRALGFKI